MQKEDSMPAPHEEVVTTNHHTYRSCMGFLDSDVAAKKILPKCDRLDGGNRFHHETLLVNIEVVTKRFLRAPLFKI